MKLGEFELNKIYCMDAIEFLKKIPDNSVDLIVIDPPFGIMPRGKMMRNGERDNYKWDNINIKEFTLEYSNKLFNKLKQDSFMYVMWSQKYFNLGIEIFKPDRIIFWRMNNLLEYVKGDFAYDYIPIFVLKKGNPKLVEGKYSCDLEFTKPQSNFKKDKLLHPTQKPLELLKHIIKISSKENDLVLDCFAGSGTTAIACLKLNRKFIGIEKEQEYIEIAKARIKPYLKQSNKNQDLRS